MTVSRKRSASLRLTTMLAGAASLTLAGCEQPTATGQWDAPGEQVEALSYADLQACKTADAVSDAECDTAYATALKDDQTDGPRYGERNDCDQAHGAGACVLRTDSNNGHSYFAPFMAGFVIGKLMNGGRPNYRGTAFYQRQDDEGGGGSGGGGGGRGFYTASGQRIGQDYRTGRTTLARSALEPASAHGRSTAVSRGGFGGGRSFGSFGG